MHVLKFGGTSMGDEQTWRRVLEIIETYERPVVVVSATAHTTRRLVAAAEAALDRYSEARNISSEIRSRHESLVSNFLKRYDTREANEALDRCITWIEKQISDLDEHLDRIDSTKQLDPARIDAVSSIGERLSSFLFAECGQIFGLETRHLDAAEIIKTDADYGRANPLFGKILENISAVTALRKEGATPVIGGYYGENEQGEPTTLGFEGSDYTASVIGAAADCEAIEIWTDVSGIFTCDPRVVEQAKPIPEISFREATEMAYFGAKILHPSTLKPAAGKNIPVYVRNIFEPDHPGTKIHGEAELSSPVRALTFLEDVVIITVTPASTLMGYHFLAGVFTILQEYHIAVDVVTTTEASVSIALEKPDNFGTIVKELEEFGEVSVTGEQGLISLVGFTLSNSDELTERVFSSVIGKPLSLISFSRDKRNLNLVLPEESLIDSVRALHQSLIEVEEISD